MSGVVAALNGLLDPLGLKTAHLDQELGDASAPCKMFAFAALSARSRQDAWPVIVTLARIVNNLALTDNDVPPHLTLPGERKRVDTGRDG